MSILNEKSHEEPTTKETGTLVTQTSNQVSENASANLETGGPSCPLSASDSGVTVNTIDAVSPNTSVDQTREQRPNPIVSPPVNALDCTPEKLQDSPAFIVTGFGSKEQLAHWFPQIEDDEYKSWRIWISKRSRALLLHIAIVGAILLVNFALTLWGVTHYAYPHGVGTIYQGSCAVVKRLDLWLHLLINLLSTGMLMASNYCMQLQAAPTRKNVDKAHDAEDWLDIGVPSLRNLRYIGNWRRFSWVLLALSSLPVHLMYVKSSSLTLCGADCDHTQIQFGGVLVASFERLYCRCGK